MRLLPTGKQGPNQRETQSHMEICVGYDHLRIGRDLINLEDKINFIKDALKLREEIVIKMRKSI